MKIRPIKRVLHEEWGGYFDSTPYFGGWVEPTAKVVWQTCFGEVTAFRSPNQISLWITNESVPEGIDFPFMEGNLVDIHKMLQRIHEHQIMRFLAPETCQEISDTLATSFYERFSQGMVRREGGIGIDLEFLREAREKFKAQMTDLHLKTFNAPVAPIVEIQKHRQLGTRVVYGMLGFPET